MLKKQKNERRKDTCEYKTRNVGQYSIEKKTNVVGH